MKRGFIFSALIFFSFSSWGQNRDTVDVCTLLNNKPSVIAFSIPNLKCILDSHDLKLKRKLIDSSFYIKDEIIGMASFLLNEYHFIEMVYQSKVCDTVAVFFILKKGKKSLRSKGYKINNLNADFRICERKNEIIIYRKIRNKGKEATVSFEVNKVNYKMDSFIDDGLSIW